MPVKMHEVKVNDHLVAWSKESRRYVAVKVTKLFSTKFQGQAQDKYLEKHTGLEYKNSWTVEDFQRCKPDDYNTLFGRKDATQSQPISEITHAGTGGNSQECSGESNQEGNKSSRDLCIDSDNSTYVRGWEPDTLMPDSSPEDLNSSEQQRLTSTAQISSASDSLESPTLEILSSTPGDYPHSPISSPAPHPANPSQSREAGEEPTTQGTASPQFSERSQLSDHDMSVLRMSGDCLAVLSAQDTEQAPISGILCGSYTSAGTMQDGKLSAQPTLEAPGVESDFLLLESPGALSSSGSGRPPGQSKLEVQLKSLGALQPEEVCNPEFLEVAYSLPTGWTDPQINTTAGEFLAATVQPEIEEAPLGTHSILALQQLPSIVSSTSIASWIDPRSVLTDAGTQSRAWEDSETIDTYTEKMTAGLWEWERQPLPVVFYDGENYYPGDCHHRIKAAIKAEAELIYVDVREGTLRDAIVYSCQANTDHGIPLRPRDQRKRIEMLLEQLMVMTVDERIALLDKVPNLTQQERAHCEKSGEWSNRVIARYLRLTASGYVTVSNIQKEREFKRLIEELGLKEGDRFQRDGVVYSIHLLLINNQKVCVQGNGSIQSMLLNEFLENFTSVEDDGCQILAPVTSAHDEARPGLYEELEEKGGQQPPQLLPDKERNEGSPLALAREDGSQADTAELLLNQLLGQIGLLSNKHLDQLIISAKAEKNRRQEYRRSA